MKNEITLPQITYEIPNWTHTPRIIHSLLNLIPMLLK